MMKDQIIEEQKGGESFSCLSFYLIVYFQKKSCIPHVETETHCQGINYYVNFLGGIGSNGFHIK